MTAIFIVSASVAWLACGRLACTLGELSTRFSGTQDSILRKADAILISALGPVALIPGASVAFWLEGHLLMNAVDRKNPFHIELQEALRLFRLLQWIPGAEAEKQRQEIIQTITELRTWPTRLREHDGDRIIAAMKAQLEANTELSKLRLQAYEEVQRELTSQMKDTFGP